MKTFKLGLIALGLITSSFSYSQEQQKKTPEQRAALKTERLAKELLLSPEQKEKVLTLYTGIAQKNDSARKSTSLSKDQKEVAIKSNNQTKVELVVSMLMRILKTTHVCRMWFNNAVLENSSKNNPI